MAVADCVVVVAISGNDVLICKSATYIQDRLKYVSGQSIYEFQRVYTLGENAAGAGATQRKVQNTPADISAATEIFEQRMEQIPARYEQQLSFMTPTWKDESEEDGKKVKERISTKYKFNERDKPFGFIKGTYPDKQHPGETLQVAAAREFKEETGKEYSLDDFKLEKSSVKKNIFILRIPEKDKEAIINSWKSIPPMQNELVELKWIPITSICEMKLNTQCDEAARLEIFGKTCGQSASTSSSSSYAPGAGQSPPTSITYLYGVDPRNYTKQDYINFLLEKKAEELKVTRKTLSLAEFRKITAYVNTLENEHGVKFKASGGQKTIRRRKSKRSKKRGTLRKGIRR